MMTCSFCSTNTSSPQQIGYRSFQRYKALALDWGMDNEYTDTDDPENDEFFDPVYQELYKLFRNAMIRQKMLLMEKMLTDEKHWRRYQWILERKFREWNLRYSSIEAERVQKNFAIEETIPQPIVQEQQQAPQTRLVPVYRYKDGTEYVDKKYPDIEPEDFDENGIYDPNKPKPPHNG